MSLNIQKLAASLKQIEDVSKLSEQAKHFWRPKEGLQTIRIVPYKFDPENSIMELKFYYKIGGRTYLAPCTFGKPDPILEMIETLRASGDEQDRELAKKLSPVTRYHAPIIVRGEEELGVRYWPFGITVWKQLVKLVSSANWGDITSYTDGNDLDLEFHKIGSKKNAKGESLPEATIIPCPKKTPAVDPTRRDLMEKLKDQANILDLFPLKTYDELKEAVNTWLYPESDEEKNPSQSEVDSAAVKGSVTSTPTPSASPVLSGDKQADEFAKFFDTK